MEDRPVVAVFGSSLPVPGDPVYLQAERLGTLVACAGWSVANGGYSGTMEAVSKGAVEAGGEAIGVTCRQIEDWRPLGPNRWLTREIRCNTLHQRLGMLVELGQASVALPGGIGTLAEIALTWSWLQTSVINAKPFVLVGSDWRHTMDAFINSFPGYIPHQNLDHLQFADDVEAAWQSVLERSPNASN